MSSPSEDLVKCAKEGDLDGVEKLLQKDAIVNYSGGVYGQTALSWAAEKGHLEVVKILLKKGAHIGIRDDMNHTALFWASQNGHRGIVVQLLSKLDSSKDVDEEAASVADLTEVFVDAAGNGWEEVTTRFLNPPGLDVNVTDGLGNTALIRASERGHLGIVQELLKKEANPSLRNEDGETPLLLAIRNNHTDVFENLSEADSTSIANDGRLLCAASAKGNMKTIHILLSKGADPWQSDHDDFLPLHRAAERGHEDALKRVISEMGDNWVNELFSRDRERTKIYSALALAICNPQIDWEGRKAEYCRATDEEGSRAFHGAALYGFLDAAQLLKDWGAHDVNILDNEGCTALLFAAYAGQSQVVNWLLQQDADVAKRLRGYTALMLAAREGHTDTVKLLVEKHRKDIDELSGRRFGFTALMLAVRNGHLDTVSCLVGFGAALNTKSKERQTALSLAMASGRLEIAKVLIQKGADIYDIDSESKSPIAHAVDQGPDFLDLILRTTDRLPIARAVEVALRYSCRNGYKRAISVIASSSELLDAKDENGRSVVSLAAEKGNRAELETLRDQKVSLIEKDKDGRTPLSWAAVGRDENTIKILLSQLQVAEAIDDSDNDKKTPLAWAAKSGRITAVKHLLDVGMYGEIGQDQAQTLHRQRTSDTALDDSLLEKSSRGAPKTAVEAIRPRKFDRASTSSRKRAGMIDINSRDSQDYTPLCHAAVNGYKGVVDLLLDHGANSSPNLPVSAGSLLGLVSNTLSGLRKKSEASPDFNVSSDGQGDLLTSLEEIEKRLSSFEPLSSRIKGSESVDERFSASVVDITEGQGYDLPKHEMKTVDHILKHGLDPAVDGVKVRWIHLPANNMRWVEVLMTKIFKSTNSREARFILESSRWSKKQHHSSSTGLHHARYMHPSCESFDFDNVDSGPSTEKSPSSTRGFVLFMPYLHWEKVEELNALKASPETGPKTEKKRKGIEELYQRYLNIDRPLHIRRTLDQFYFGEVIKTDARDKDQTCHRDYDRRDFKTQSLDKISVMVDQLWLWIIPEWNGAPPIVITAFPQRAHRINDLASSSWRMTALVFRILQNCGTRRVRTAPDLAQVIVAECSTIFFDDRSRQTPILQFFDIYSRSIAWIANRDTERFTAFSENVRDYRKTLDFGSPTRDEGRIPSKTKNITQKERRKNDNYVLNKLIDISDDIADLRDIKDIKEELSMMSSLFKSEKEVADTFHSLLIDQNKHSLVMDQNRLEPRSPPQSDAAPDPSKQIRQNEQETNRLNSLMFASIRKGSGHVAQLHSAAGSTADDIQQLIELKNKQANLREVKSARELSEETGRQSTIIMIFTVVTIVFLPPSFMSSFLALQISQFPWKDDKLPLSYVLKTLLSVAFGIIVPTLLLAFRVEIRELLTTIRKQIILHWELLVILRIYFILLCKTFIAMSLEAWKRLSFSTGDSRRNAGSVGEGDV